MSKSRKQRRKLHAHGAAAPQPGRNGDATQSAGTTEQPIIIHQAELNGYLGDVPHEPSAQERIAGADVASAHVAPPVLHETRDHAGRDTTLIVESEGQDIPVEPAQAVTRAYSIDALRGLFLVLMTLGFTIQGGGMFPDWMYHRQPSAEAAVAGITWRDLAYAAFIFTMAAAFPITLSRRIDKGELEIGIAAAAVRRGALLFVFALLIGHANTYFIGYTQTGRVLAVIGFAIMFALFVRRRSDWNERWFGVMRSAAWVAAIAFLLLSPLAYDSTFRPDRRDQVIAILAVAAVVGSLIWYATRNNLNARLAVLGATVALYLGARGEGWLSAAWWSSPAPWLFQPSNLSVLAVVIPGTIAGDHVLRWMRATGPDEPDVKHWSAGRIMLLSAICAAFTPLAVIGLYNRWVLPTTQLTIALCLAGALLVHRATYPGERLLRSLFSWGAVWLLLGLFSEPFEGGIKKVPETLSYYFTITGLTTMLLAAMAGMIDVLKRRRWANALLDVGQNPMLCYVLFTVLLNSIFELIPPLRSALRGSPGASILRSILTVVLVVLIVRAFTRARIYWRT
jgi:predicted acyltransferase